MRRVAAKLGRLREAATLTLVHAARWQSRRRILECYADLAGAVADATLIDLELKCGRQRRPCRLRRSDVFTLAEIFHDRQYELRTRIPPTPVVIDAGANIGLASLWLSGRHAGATIHAFEPELTNFQLLEHNLRPVAGARPNRAALGEYDGEIGLRLSTHGAMHRTSSTPTEGPTVRVPIMRLDTYLERHGLGAIDLLKLDVEGAELRVLEGLGMRIADVGVIIGEVHERLADVDAFYAYLRASGFENIRRIPFRGGTLEGVHGFEASRPIASPRTSRQAFTRPHGERSLDAAPGDVLTPEAPRHAQDGARWANMCATHAIPADQRDTPGPRMATRRAADDSVTRPHP